MILFILEQDPFTGLQGLEAQEAVLGASAYFDDIAVLFQGPAVQALATKNHPLREDGLKNYLKTYAAFSLYDIDKVYAAARACEAFSLKKEDLIPVALLSDSGIQALRNKANKVLVF